MDVRYIIKAFLLFFLLNACNKKDKIYSENGVLLREENYDNDGLLHGITIHYFETGQIKAKIPFNHGVRDGKEIVYDSIGNVKIIYTHNNGILDTMKFYSIPGKLTSLIYLKDSDFYENSFDENGNKRAEGFLDKDTELKKGWWRYFNEDGFLFSDIEYLNINNEEYANQVIEYDNSGNKNKEKSSYYNLIFPDTTIKGRIAKGVFNLNTYLSKDEDFYEVFFDIQDEEGNNIFKDTTFGQNEKAAIINYRPKKLGKFKLNGIALERGHNIEPSKEDSTMLKVDYLSRRIYFEKYFEVVD
jgi:antitoxin component YwqK of YwqJK toxin-antitoxin module